MSLFDNVFMPIDMRVMFDKLKFMEVEGNNVVQGSPEWFALRAQCKITASAAAEYMGIGYDSMKAALLRWNGIVKEPGEFARRMMDQGRREEPYIRRLLEGYTHNPIHEVGFYTRHVPELGCSVGASPDGIMWLPKSKGHVCVEIKRPFKHLYAAPKLNHIVQMYMQMYCTQLTHCVYAVYHPDEGMRVWLLPFRKRVWRFIVNRLNAFMCEYTQGETKEWPTKRWTTENLNALLKGSIIPITGLECVKTAT